MSMSGAAADTDRFAFSRGVGGTKRRVLYAEDQTTTRIVTTALLERMGFEVVAVEDGELAVEEARLGPFDLILMDIEMPVMDGVTAARSIRAEPGPCREVPILALSAFLADSTEHCIWRDAFDCALPKPATSLELQEAMHSALTQSRSPKMQGSQAMQTGWMELGRTLPQGALKAIANAAREQMEHLVLAMASCAEAGDEPYVQKCQQALGKMANSFGSHELKAALANLDEQLTALDTQELLQVIADWHKTQATWH